MVVILGVVGVEVTSSSSSSRSSHENIRNCSSGGSNCGSNIGGSGTSGN